MIPSKSYRKKPTDETAFTLKEKGNDAFKRKEYEVAENLYSEGLQKLNPLDLDSRPLWTNRAICLNILEKHEDALTDSVLALAIDPKCAKADFQNEG